MRAAFAITLLFIAQPAFAQSGHGVPDLCGSGITKTASSGAWNTAGTWTPSGVPGAGARVSIPVGVTVTYDANSTTLIECIGLAGTLQFTDGATRKLTVEDFNVYEGGRLEIGTAADPFTSSATIVFDGDIDAGSVGTPGADPEQFGVGLLVEGEIEVFGVARTAFARLTAAVASSATTVTVASCPSGWANGDALYIPATDQSYDEELREVAQGGTGVVSDEHEEFTMSSCSGGTITLSGATARAHPCGKDKNGTCVKYPHIANYTRNIVFRSLDPEGVRGHTLYNHGATVDIRHALFQDMGRTLNAALNCTLYTTSAEQQNHMCTPGTGALTQIGTNQIGRYPVHFHHLHGPENLTDTGYQYRFEGNAIIDSKKWPLTVHNSHYGLIKDNVVLHGDTGAGVMVEFPNGAFLGVASYNEFDGNFVCSINEGPNNTTSPRDAVNNDGSGRDGTGFYITNFNQTFTNNVACNIHNSFSEIVSGVGFKFFVNPAPRNVYIPDFRGADPEVDGTAVVNQYQTIGGFSNNEVYGRTRAGMTIWHLGTAGNQNPAQAESLMEDFSCWHLTEGCFFGYPTDHLTFDGLTFYNDEARLAGASYLVTYGDYGAHRVVIRDCVAHNIVAAINRPENFTSITVENCDIKAEVGIHILLDASPGGGNQCLEPTRWYYANFAVLGVMSVPTTTVVWRNVTVSHPATCTLQQYRALGSTGCRTIVMDWTYPTAANSCPNTPYSVTVEDYQGTPGLDFEVFFNEQGAPMAPDIVTAAENNITGVDIQVWDGIAAGELAPCTDTTTYPEIDGIACGAGVPAGTNKHQRIFRRRRIR